MADAELTLALEIVDVEGRPVAGASTQVIRNNTVANWCSWPDRERRSDDDGRVDIPGLSATPLPFGERTVVSITHPDFAEELLYRPEELPRDGEVIRRRVVLSPGATLHGTVRGGPKAEVSAWWLDARVPGCHGVSRRTVAADDGAFLLTGLRPGEHKIRVAGGFVPIATTVVVPREAPVELAAEQGIRLTGVVLGEDGLPFAGATVDIDVPAQRQSWRIETGSDGLFAREGLPPGETIEVHAFAQRPDDELAALGAAVVPPSTADCDVVLDARARVRLGGVLVDGATGKPFTGWSMVAARLAGTSICFHSTGGADGRFDARLPRGRYDVAFTTNDEESTLGGVIVRGLDVEADQDDLVIQGHAAFAVSVSIRDADSGEPIPGAAAASSFSALLSLAYLEMANEDGIARFERVLRGPMILDVEAAGHQRFTSEILQVESGDQPIEVRLTKRPPA